ncbi:MAG: hypothetical protein BHW65_08720 [Verrucomicrobia bacterium CAG:312_58_20]|nr:MAG: hypothetical protein BHW65_08720 [Verrucomicrobia bacterium CAG:312_58_20]
MSRAFFAPVLRNVKKRVGFDWGKGIRSAANFFAAERRFAEPERDLVRNNFRRIERFLESRPLLRGFAGTRVWNLVLNGKIDSEFLII